MCSIKMPVTYNDFPSNRSQARYQRKVLGNTWKCLWQSYGCILSQFSINLCAFNYASFPFLLKKSAYCSEQINKFVVGQIALSSSFDWLSLIWEIYHQPILLEKSFHIIRSFWILERRLCRLPWLQGIYVRNLELGFHLHYDNIHFHTLIPVRHSVSALPSQWMSLFELYLC